MVKHRDRVDGLSHFGIHQRTAIRDLAICSNRNVMTLARMIETFFLSVRANRASKDGFT